MQSLEVNVAPGLLYLETAMSKDGQSRKKHGPREMKDDWKFPMFLPPEVLFYTNCFLDVSR